MEATPVSLEEALRRYARCDPQDLQELAALADGIERADEQDNMEAVENMPLALLRRGQDLPAYYKAQCYTWLSTCEGYDRVDYTQEAAYHIVQARGEREHLGFSAKDLGEWTNLIWEHKDEAVAEEKGEAFMHTDERKDTPDASSVNGPLNTKPSIAIASREEHDVAHPSYCCHCRFDRSGFDGLRHSYPFDQDGRILSYNVHN